MLFQIVHISPKSTIYENTYEIFHKGDMKGFRVSFFAYVIVHKRRAFILCYKKNYNFFPNGQCNGPKKAKNLPPSMQHPDLWSIFDDF